MFNRFIRSDIFCFALEFVCLFFFICLFVGSFVCCFLLLRQLLSGYICINIDRFNKYVDTEQVIRQNYLKILNMIFNKKV